MASWFLGSQPACEQLADTVGRESALEQETAC